MSSGSSLTKTPKTWKQLRSIVESGRKLVASLNQDVPSSINFRELVNPETGRNEYRVYFLAGNAKREITIKYVTVQPGTVYPEKLVGNALFSNANYLQGPAGDKQLTKEEQLLRERKRCSFTGITQYSLNNSGRFLFSERSELFCYDDDLKLQSSAQPTQVTTCAKGAIDIKICPFNSNIISYVLEDNLWIQDLTSKTEIKLTHTEAPVKSGVPSYAVQEEFNRYSGYWWYPANQFNEDGSATYRLVYEETDESDVEMTYITPSCTGDDTYDEYRYPRVGTPNSKVFLKMIEFTVPVDPTKPIQVLQKRMHRNFYELFNWFEYLTRAEFTPDGKSFWVEIYDRLQGHTASLLVPLDFFVPDVEASMQIDETAPMNIYMLSEYSSDTWTNSHNSMTFLNEGGSNLAFITASDESGFLHLYYYKISLDKANFTQLSDGVLKSKSVERRQITSGDWCCDADESITVDQKNHLVYFHAYVDPTECQFYVVDYTDPSKFKQLTKSGFSHSVSINQQANMFITACSNLSTASQSFIFELSNQEQGVDSLTVTQLAQMTGRQVRERLAPSEAGLDLVMACEYLSHVFDTPDSKEKRTWSLENQPDADASVVGYFFRPPQIFDFLTPDGTKLYGMVYLPYQYVEGQVYPTLQFVYGGPGAQLVTNAYKIQRFSRLNMLSLLGYCVVVIDSRGSNNRGLAFEAYLKHRMGTVEIADQVLGLEAACLKYGCIDMKRVALFGWSYGGYMALMGLAQRPDVYKVVVSGAPVTTWNLYDTAYTERYMGLPDVNSEAYANGSVLNLANKFPDEENRLLIIHGMIDENVHFSNTRKLIDALIKEGKPYRLQIYPQERHGIRSPDSSMHCDLNFYTFLENNL